ncbi:MAG: methyltransferase domain-containing protein [Hydrogenophaga sp.]|uniref:methyltransferase domain-containing protein n=1 Tax=Hydrogenophaga sp. TaxID=1904254 RepID=UPI0025BAF2AA|nr:methyltransferase domain-containing protein [Hydrogenophaga sp.]MBT9551227.1 methyltransferase domain-containing protein [Hydrogenophaga sp.]
MINSLVADLPEVYQPIYGHPELSRHVSRTSQDRLEHIARIHDAIQRLLGRPLRVLDLGCAQAYFSLNLAERGATVHGVDYLDKNISVCCALARENAALQVSFETGRIEDVITRLEPGQYDLVLGLSVFHHIVHEKGVAVVQALLGRAAAQCGALVLELALREEPLYWGPAQPKDPRSLLDSIPFIHEVARHSTHLANIVRPLLVASDKYWILSGQAYRFHSWTMDPHTLAHGLYQSSRRYFFGEDQVVKLYRFDHILGDVNRDHFTNEMTFLRNPPIGFSAPNLIVCDNNETEAWVAMQRLPGRLLLDLLRENVALDTHALLLFVLDQLASLEAVGLFHNDVRTWNILVAEDGAVHLIDYGSISPVAQDCVWPANPFFAFFIFVREVITGEIDDPDPLRTIAITPLRLPARYQAWATALWHRPLTEWSFHLMHQTLLKGVDDGDSRPSPNNPQDVWMQVIEEAIQTQKNLGQHIRAGLNAVQTELKAFVAPAQQATASADNALSIAQQAMDASQQTRDLITGFESTLQQYQSLAVASEQRIHALLSSTSWQITAPLRWLSLQRKLLATYGCRSRFRALLKKILLRQIVAINARPQLRMRLVKGVRRLGLYPSMRELYFRLQGQPESNIAPDLNAQTPPRSDFMAMTEDHLSPRTRQIYINLKDAIEHHRKENG